VHGPIFCGPEKTENDIGCENIVKISGRFSIYLLIPQYIVDVYKFSTIYIGRLGCPMKNEQKHNLFSCPPHGAFSRLGAQIWGG
jgi:hypothetical protein